MKRKRRIRQGVVMVIFGILILPAAGCDRYAKDRVLTFFFPDRPSFKEDQQETEGTEKKTGKSTARVKKKSAPVTLSMHSFYAARACDRCHQGTSTTGSGGQKAAGVFSWRAVMPGRLRAPPNRLCVLCHKNMSAAAAAADGLWLHAPAALGHCVMCHDPHKSPNPYLLKSPDTVCTQCHTEGFIMNTEVHKERTDCMSCHNPHLGRNRLLLTKDYREAERNEARPIPDFIDSKDEQK